MLNIKVGQLEQNSRQLLARMLITTLNDQRKNEYASWASVSHLDWVKLYDADDKELSREEYPPEFDEYLPDISVGDGDTSFAVSTIPSRDGATEGVRVCLGHIWDSRIVRDMNTRFLTGSKTAIKDETPTESRIPGWKLNKVEIRKKTADDIEKVAFLFFEKIDGSEKLVARWGWSKRTPPSL